MSEERAVLLHIGPHRTGSTFLQQTFTKRRRALRRQGVEYPTAGAEFGRGHHNLAWLIRGRPLRNTTQQQLRADIAALVAKGPRAVLLSSEEFVAASAEQIAMLRELFPGYRIRPVFARRTGISLVPSLWQDMVMHGSRTSLDRLTLKALVGRYGYNPVDASATIRRWEEALETDVAVIDFDAARANHENLVERFAADTGVAIRPAQGAANASLALDLIELIRAANAHSLSIGRRPRLQARHLAQSVLRGRSGRRFRGEVQRIVGNAKRPVPDATLVNWGIEPDTVSDANRPIAVPGQWLFHVLQAKSPPGWIDLVHRMESLPDDDREDIADRTLMRRVLNAVRRPS